MVWAFFCVLVLFLEIVEELLRAYLVLAPYLQGNFILDAPLYNFCSVEDVIF